MKEQTGFVETLKLPCGCIGPEVEKLTWLNKEDDVWIQFIMYTCTKCKREIFEKTKLILKAKSDIN